MRRRAVSLGLVAAATVLLLVALVLDGGSGMAATPAAIEAGQVPVTPRAEPELVSVLEPTPAGRAAEVAAPEATVEWEEPAATRQALRTGHAERADGLLVRVRTRVGRDPDSASVGAVPIGVGLGNALAPGSAPLVRATTDASGLAEVTLPWSQVEHARRSEALVWARPTERGWRWTTAIESLPSSEHVVELDVTALPGVSVRGRVFGPDGVSPHFYVNGVQQGEADRSLAQSDRDGWFLLHLPGPGIYDVHASPAPRFGADAGSVFAGSASLFGVEVDLDDPPLLELVLQGAGVVRGVVLGADGRGVAGLLLALSMSGANVARAEELRHEGLGGTDGLVTTDAEGRFEFAGLRPALYELSADGRRLTDHPVPSDGLELVLRLAEAPRLVVRVLDEDGAPWSGPLDPQAAWDGHVADEWPETPGVYVARARPAEAWQARDDRLALPGRIVGPGLASFEVQHGEEYEVAVWGGSFAWRPQRVVVPTDGSLVDVTIAAEAGETALVTVHVEGVDDEVVRRSLAVHLEDPASGRPLLVHGPFLGDPWPLEVRVPAGSWRLAVEGHAATSHGGWFLRTAQRGRFETELTVEAGQRVAVTARPPAGARIDLELLGEVRDADREAILRDVGRRREPELTDLAARASIRLRSPGRWPRPVLFPHEVTEPRPPTSRAPPTTGTRLFGHLEVGTRGLSDLVPAGHWILEASLPGGRFASREVTLVDGRTSTVVLGL